MSLVLTPTASLSCTVSPDLEGHPSKWGLVIQCAWKSMSYYRLLFFLNSMDALHAHHCSVLIPLAHPTGHLQLGDSSCTLLHLTLSSYISWTVVFICHRNALGPVSGQAREIMLPINKGQALVDKCRSSLSPKWTILRYVLFCFSMEFSAQLGPRWVQQQLLSHAPFTGGYLPSLVPFLTPLLEPPRITSKLTAGTQVLAWDLLLGKPKPKKKKKSIKIAFL